MSTAGTLYDETIRLGHMKLITAQACAGAAVVDFVSGINPSAYDSFLFEIDSIAPVAAAYFGVNISHDAGATWRSDGYEFYSENLLLSNPGNAPQYFTGLAQSWHRFYIGWYNASDGNPISGEFRVVIRPLNGFPRFTWHTGGYCPPANGYTNTLVGGGAINLASYGINSFNGVRFAFDGTSIANGFIRLYGLKTGA